MRVKLNSFKKAVAILKRHKPPFRIRYGKEWNDKGDLCQSQSFFDADDKKCLLILTAAYRADVYALAEKKVDNARA